MPKPEKNFPTSADGIQEACYRITGCAIDILNTLGPGLPEDVYESCLKIEMSRRGIPFESGCRREITYLGEKVGEARVPFVVAGRLVVACVVSDAFNDTDHSRYLGYLRALGLPMALLLNFQFGKLQWKKISSERF